METNQQPGPSAGLTQEQILLEILENTKKTRNFIKWQMYITIAFVVLPLVGMLFMVPMLMSSLGNLGSIYSGGGLQ